MMREGKENTFPPEDEGQWEMPAPRVINGSNAKRLRKQKTSYSTVMEFIPSVQNVAPALNRGPSVEERVLSPGNALRGCHVEVRPQRE